MQRTAKILAKIRAARAARLFINFLLTDREGRTGEYWPEVVAVRTEGQYSPVRLEQARLVNSLLYGFLITFCFVFASP